MLRLLIADESDAVRKVAAHILADLGFSVTGSPNALDALARCEASLPEVVIVDSGLVGALELIANLRSLPNGRAPQIFYSLTSADLRSLMAGKRAGADDFLLKPFERKVLSATFAGLANTAAA